jgi:hypothetical protein
MLGPADRPLPSTAARIPLHDSDSPTSSHLRITAIINDMESRIVSVADEFFRRTANVRGFKAWKYCVADGLRKAQSKRRGVKAFMNSGLKKGWNGCCCRKQRAQWDVPCSKASARDALIVEVAIGADAERPLAVDITWRIDSE